jgi:hypothetical protein
MFYIFELFFYDYAEIGCLDTSLNASKSAKIPKNTDSGVPMVPDSMKKEIEDLRQQLQLLKK